MKAKIRAALANAPAKRRELPKRKRTPPPGADLCADLRRVVDEEKYRALYEDMERMMPHCSLHPRLVWERVSKYSTPRT